jgi:hypothetical protein
MEEESGMLLAKGIIFFSPKTEYSTKHPTTKDYS